MLQIISLIAITFFVLGQPVAQASSIENKKRGLELLHSGQAGTALYYLNQARLSGVVDGEVLGGLALAYFLEGDAQRALLVAEEAMQAKDHPSADGYLAGFLAQEQLGNVKQRDRWMKLGLEQFPDDFLLLYHAGRVTLSTDAERGQTFLLRAIRAAPGFPASHLLLGENMYRRGENIKAMLPMLYYLLLDHDSQHSKDLLEVISNLFDTWAVSTPSISRVTRVSPGVSAPFTPAAWSGYPGSDKLKMDWLNEQIYGLISSMQYAEVSSDDAMWTFYTDFFANAARLNFTGAMAKHILYSKYRAEVMQWLLQNSQEYQRMADWMLLQ